jgi:hypothetical protein
VNKYVFCTEFQENMIAKNQIRFLLGNIENERVGRTISTKDTDKFTKAICAFANDLPNKRKPCYLPNCCISAEATFTI